MEPPTYDELQQFLDRRLRTLESLQPLKPDPNAVKPRPSTSAKQTRALHARGQDGKPGRCTMCQRDHFVMLCDTYKSKSAAKRKHHVEANGLCLNCLGKHRLSDCPSKKSCSVCNSRHHTSLHDACHEDTVRTTHVSHNPSKPQTAVLLVTARVTDRHGNSHSARALIDQRSESSLVSESLAQRLRLPRKSTSIAIFGVGGKMTGVARGLMTLEVSSKEGKSPMTVSALILPQLTIYDGCNRAERRPWGHLAGLDLADFLSTDPVDCYSAQTSTPLSSSLAYVEEDLRTLSHRKRHGVGSYRGQSALRLNTQRALILTCAMKKSNYPAWCNSFGGRKK